MSETRDKKGRFLKGCKLTDKIKKKMSLIKRGKIPKNIELIKNYWKGKHLSEITKIKIGLAHKGKKWTEKQRKNIIPKLKRGKKHYRWKGGITPIYINERNKYKLSIEYRLWREAIFARDNWTCQKCNIKGGKLHPHHIQNWSSNKELRTSIENGIILCEKCHRLFHHIYGIKNNNVIQIRNFLLNSEIGEG